MVNLYERGGHCHTAFFTGCTAFTSVEKLTLRNSVIELHLIYAFACALPGLTHLVVGNIRPTVAAFYPYPPQLGDPRLVSVSLDVGPMYRNALKRILGWLKLTASTRTLRSVSFTARPPEVSDIGIYFAEHGALLEEVSVDIRADAEQDLEGATPSRYSVICS